MLLLCGLLAFGIVVIPILGIILIGMAVLATLCCCGCCLWYKSTLRMIFYRIPKRYFKAITWLCDQTESWFLRMLGANFGREEGNIAPPISTELMNEQVCRPARYIIGDFESGISHGLELDIKKLIIGKIPLAHPWFEFPRGSSCIRNSSASTSPDGAELGCNIYQHTYNPRGPVGYLAYFAPGIGQRENHPTGFLFLGAGKLSLAACKSPWYQYSCWGNFWFGS